MEKAYDRREKAVIDAVDAAKDSLGISTNSFRYLCLHCEEEVYLAAVGSRKQRPHFRHRRGNNDTECEAFLGNLDIEHIGKLAAKIKAKGCWSMKLYFNAVNKCFEIGIKVPGELLGKVVTDTIWVKADSKALFEIDLKEYSLLPDVRHFFILSEYAKSYRLFVEDTELALVNGIKAFGSIAMFKIKEHDVHATRSDDNVIYTNTMYIAVSEDESFIKSVLSIREFLYLEESFSFNTMGRKYYAVSFSIDSINDKIKSLFTRIGVIIRSIDYFEVLWPPMVCKEDNMICGAQKIFASANFRLLKFDNIKSDKGLTVKKENGCYEICGIDELTVNVNSNQNVYVLGTEVRQSEEYIKPITEYLNKWTVDLDEDSDCFMFDGCGCTRLYPGTKQFLLSDSRIVVYKNRHIKKEILPVDKKLISKAELIRDIEMYHPQMENFSPEDFLDIELNDNVVIDYIEKCYMTGKVNSVVKALIKEGKL